MFDKLFRRRKPAPQADPAPPPSSRPFLAVELDPATNNVKVYAHLPHQATEQASLDVAANFGSMAFLLNEGSLLSMLQQAIAVAGSGDGKEGMAQTALASINTLVQARARNRSCPVVRPTSALTPGRDFGGNE